MCWFFGPYFIKKLKKRQIGQSVRDDGPLSHLKKKGTPTMGGGLILLSVFIPSFFWVDLTSHLVWSLLLILTFFGFVGYLDDRIKIMKESSKGVSGRWRLLMEFVFSGLVVGFLLYKGVINSEVYIPFFKDVSFDLGWFYLPFACFVIVGCANAVNLTDGLDGLVIVPVMVCAGTLLIFSYVTGHSVISDYLSIPFVSGAGELSPLLATVVAAALGFLWFNTYPAQIFMGDVGSLSLGGFLGMVAVLVKQELLLAFLGGIFVIETLSVITQVISFKLTGKRIFKMAPIHHHFELKGMDESKIIVRFWIISVLLAVLSLATLKLR